VPESSPTPEGEMKDNLLDRVVLARAEEQTWDEFCNLRENKPKKRHRSRQSTGANRPPRPTTQTQGENQ
jgi:hypothetical protein